MDGLRKRVLHFIAAHSLLRSGERAVVALSGGPDSVALVVLLHELAASGDLRLDLRLAHLNHRLRGAESDADEAFCRELAGELALPIETDAVDLPRPTEAAARQARYEFLGAVARRADAAAVATAHHADDVAETVLMRMIRGAGVTGLAAMSPCRPLSRSQPGIRLVRPLLQVTGAELRAFLAERGRAYRTDSSNRDTAYTRNRVRHELLPMLARDYPEFTVASLCALNTSALELRDLLGRLTEETWPRVCREMRPNEVSLDAGALDRAPMAVRKAVMGRALRIAAGTDGPPALTAQHWEALVAVAAGRVGRQLSLPGGLSVRREHGLLHVTGSPPRAGLIAERKLPVPGSAEVPEANMRITSQVLPAGAVDADGVAGLASSRTVFVDLAGRDALAVRSRLPGDRFRPLGLAGTMRLKKYLIGRRVPFHLRDRTPLIVTPEGQIVWVVGCDPGEAFKLGKPGERVVRLDAEPLEDEPTD